MVIQKINTRFVIIMSLLFIVLYLSASCKKITYKERFKLNNLELKHYDLYNPILNTFKLNPIERKQDDAYDFDVYLENNTIKYSFSWSGSYGYLQEYIYDARGTLSIVNNYPVLGEEVQEREPIYINDYIYSNGKLRAIKDELNSEIIIINDDATYVYRGILRSAEPFEIEKINSSEYFIKHLSGGPSNINKEAK